MKAPTTNVNLKRGDEAALQALAQELHPRLVARAQCVLHDRSRAEDVVQDTTLKLWQGKANLPAEEPALRAYVFRAVTNAAINELRSLTRRRRTEKLAAKAERKPQPNDDALQAWELAGSLPDEEREVLELRYLEGLTAREVAARLGVPEGTVNTRQRSGLENLRSRLASAGVAALSVGALATMLGQLWKGKAITATVAVAAGSRAAGWLLPAAIGGGTVACVVVVAALLLSAPVPTAGPANSPAPVAAGPAVTQVPAPAARKGPLLGAYVETLRHGGEADVASLDMKGFDFVVHGFVEPAPDGALKPSPQFERYREAGLVQRIREQGAVPVVSIGGATYSANFAAVAASPAATQRLIADLERLLRGGYGGVDINWQFPQPAQRELFTRFMTQISAAAKRVNQDALVTFGAGTGYWLDSFDWKALAGCCDYAFVCGYSWNNPAGGPVRNPGGGLVMAGGGKLPGDVSGALEFVVKQGFPREKLLCGVAFHGSDGRPWLEQTEAWGDAATHPDYLEAQVGGVWWNTPAGLPRKLDALAPLAGGFFCFELGHEDPARAELSRAMRHWRK